jgi:hypothetical protein
MIRVVESYMVKQVFRIKDFGVECRALSNFLDTKWRVNEMVYTETTAAVSEVLKWWWAKRSYW